MDKKTVIEILEKEKAYMQSHGGDSQKEALETAIRALDQNEKLQNRCHALTKGLVCMCCPYDCEYREGANSGT